MIARSTDAGTPLLPAPALLADEDLVRRVRHGDERAFETIYNRYREPLHRYCHSIVRQREDAEEAFQATMLSAFRALTTGEEREIALRPWLYRIAHNACISTLRRRSREAAAPLSGLEEAPGGVEEQSEMAEDLRQLRRDLAELPDAQRSALVMRELGGLSHVEIGRALDEEPAAVKQTIYNARLALHDLVAGRELACESVRRTISDGDRRQLRGRSLRAHVRACAGCRSWEETLRTRPARLAALAPVLPAVVFHEILQAVLGTAAGTGAVAAGAGAVGGGVVSTGAGAAGAGAAATGAGAAAAGGGIGGGLAVKLAVIGSATLIGGSTAVIPALDAPARDGKAAAPSTRGATPGADAPAGARLGAPAAGSNARQTVGRPGAAAGRSRGAADEAAARTGLAPGQARRGARTGPVLGTNGLPAATAPGRARAAAAGRGAARGQTVGQAVGIPSAPAQARAAARRAARGAPPAPARATPLPRSERAAGGGAPAAAAPSVVPGAPLVIPVAPPAEPAPAPQTVAPDTFTTPSGIPVPAIPPTLGPRAR